MKHLLVPIDFSAVSEEAFNAALFLAEKTNAKITLLHVLYIPMMYNTGVAGEPLAFDPVYITQLETDAHKMLERLKAKAPSSREINLEVVYGEIIFSLNQFIGHNHVDLIVMGTSGTSGVAAAFIGSTTEKIVRNSPVPVLAVRNASALPVVKNIVLPAVLDLKETAFIEKVKALQQLFSATLHVLYINTPSHFQRDVDSLAALEEFARHYRLTSYQLHCRNDRTEEQGILDFCHRQKADLLAMGTHGRKGLAHLFNGSITEDVVNHIQGINVWTCQVH